MPSRSCFKLATTFSLLLLIFVMSLILPNSTRLATALASAAFQPTRVPGTSTTQSQLKCGGWHVVPSPPGANKIFFGVAATSTNDAWTVGYINNGSNDETLIEHWDGTSWSIIPSANPGSNENILRAVTTTSANDA